MPELIYVTFHRPTGAARMAPVTAYRLGPTYERLGPPFLEPDTPLPVDGPLPTSPRTTGDVEAVLLELGWKTITRREAGEVWVNGWPETGGFLWNTHLPGSGHILAADTADERVWAGDEFTVCAFAVIAADVATLVLPASRWVPERVDRSAEL